jgi:PhnB protein
MAVKPVPEGYHTVTACFVVEKATRAINFYKQAFSAEELYRMPMGDKIGHAEIRIGDTHLMLSDEWPDLGEPKSTGRHDLHVRDRRFLAPTTPSGAQSTPA